MSALVPDDALAADVKTIPRKHDHVEVKELNKELDSSTESSFDGEKPKAPWWSLFWDYDPGQSKEERKFVNKLDW